MHWFQKIKGQQDLHVLAVYFLSRTGQETDKCNA